MKKLLFQLTFLLLFVPALVQAQDDEMETLTGTASLTGAYGAASNKFSSIDGDFANFVGGYGGILLNKSYLLGLGGYVSVNPIYDLETPISRYSQRLVYFGIMNEYSLKPTKLVHLSFSTLAGTALMINQLHTKTSPTDNYWTWENENKTKAYVMVDPKLDVNINILKNLKLAAGVSYRTVFGDSRASGLAADVTIKAGKF